jgi:hypothetical protein
VVVAKFKKNEKQTKGKPPISCPIDKAVFCKENACLIATIVNPPVNERRTIPHQTGLARR